MKQVTLDCSELTGIDGLHDKLAELLEFPDYYGANLDALYDMLTTGDELELLLLHPEALDRLPGGYGQRFLDTLKDAAEDQPRFHCSLPCEDELGRVISFMRKCGVFFLATDEEGQPRIRPFGAVDRFEDKLYLQTGRVKKVFRQLEDNPRIELCCLAPEGDAWLRLTARAVLDPRLEARRHMLESNPSLQSMYAADDGNCEVFYLAEAEASFYSFTAAPETLRF